jgi:tetratricopeptide (TPR) repeat protein
MTRRNPNRQLSKSGEELLPKSASSSPAGAAPVRGLGRPPAWLIAVSLALVTLVLYWPATRYDFVDYDDNMYVLENPHVSSGLTPGNALWSFKTGYAANWHPVTWLSHMLDDQLFGLKPGGHHFTNVLLHALNAALVFVLLRQMTGANWRSLLVAALFAVHPLRVESVAWVAERKDVLSGFFGLLALICYALYAGGRRQKAEGRMQKPGITKTPALPRSTVLASRLTSHPRTSYLLALLFLALGLMSKPMLVTWPFVMLLLDFWPLQRSAARGVPNAEPGAKGTGRDGACSWWKLVWEKVPFFVLATVASVVTFLVQQRGGAVEAVEILPLGARVGNALISYWRYLAKLFWPADMAVFYPHPGHWSLPGVLLGGGGILASSVLLFVQRRREPFLLAGWLWFCGTLVPAIGLVQVGSHSMADRYTYLPVLGVFVLSVWGAWEMIRPWHYGRVATWVASTAVIIPCLALTRRQLGFWQESEVLFRHALDVTENNEIAHKAYGDALEKRGQTDEAISHYREAIRLKPGYADAHNNLGIALGKKGRVDEAIDQYQEALRRSPNDANACYNLGNALDRKGQTEAAIAAYQAAIRLNPEHALAYYNLGLTLGRAGQTDAAIRQFEEAIRLKPEDALAHFNLGVALGKKGQVDASARQLQEAIRLKPDYAEADNNLGTALDQLGRTDEAIRHYQEAIRLKPDYAGANYNLGLTLARVGRMSEAIRQYQEAIRLMPDYAPARYNLGIAFEKQGQIEEAIRQLQEALRLKPDYADARQHLEAVLTTKGDASK